MCGNRARERKGREGNSDGAVGKSGDTSAATIRLFEVGGVGKKLNGKPETKDATTHVIAAQKAVHALKAMSKPFLNWSGNRRRRSNRG